MKSWLRGFGLLAGLVLSFQLHAAKPATPIMVTIAPLEAVSTGQETRFKVTVQSQVSLDELVIRIHPVGAVKWGKGEQRWRGAVQGGVPVSVEFSVIVAKPESFELHAVATMQGKRGGGFGARTVYRYEDPAMKKPAPQEQKTLRHGQEIIEVPLR